MVGNNGERLGTLQRHCGWNSGSGCWGRALRRPVVLTDSPGNPVKVLLTPR
jgi:hypothetical protein